MQRHYLEAALQAAIVRHHSNTALKLIDVMEDQPVGSKLDSVDLDGKNFLQHALIEGMHEVAMRLLDMQERFPNLELALHQDNRKATPILLAVRHSMQIILVMRLLNHAAKGEGEQFPNYLLPDSEGRTPLLEAADQSRPDILMALLERIAKRGDASHYINYFSVVGSPLHVACRKANPNTAVITALINRGANVLLPDQMKETPLDLISQFSFTVIRNIMHGIEDDKRGPFIPIYRKELLTNKQADLKGYFDLTAMHSLKMHLLARLEFDKAFSHLESYKEFTRLAKGKEEADAPDGESITALALDDMLRLANSEEAVYAVGQLLSGDLKTINQLLEEIADYEEMLAGRSTFSIGYKVGGSLIFLGGTAGLMACILFFSGDFKMPENKFATVVVIIAIVLLCIAILLVTSVATTVACLRQPHYQRSDWHALATHINDSLLKPLLIAAENELPQTLPFANAIQAELRELNVYSLSLPQLKTHAADLKSNINQLKHWMIWNNKPFTLFAPPPAPPPAVEVVVDLDDASSADYEMETMHDTRPLLGGNNNNI